jgi:TonB-linked SusC/RagA family outer membrane protein
VKITTGSGSVGASTRIILRGEASLTGDNNALIVIDGVPIDNSSSFGGERGGEAGYADFGNRFNDFNPENIETLTILKGPAATSLYGSRGASGVVVITTKSGSRDQMKVNFSSTTSVEQAYVLLKRQTQYGQGLINPDGSNNFDSGENFSWGPKFDGVVRPWTSPVDPDGDGTYEWLSRPYTAVDKQMENFFRTGATYNNSLSFSGGSDKYTYFLSYGHMRQNGIMDNTDYKRHSLNLNASAKLSSKLKSRLSLSYSNVNQNTAQEGSRAFEGQNPYANAVQAATNIDYRQLRDYKSPFHDFKGFYGSYAINPYFILNEYLNNGKSNNFLASAALDYTPVENLTISTNIGTNYVGFDRRVGIPQYEYQPHYVWEDKMTLTFRDRNNFNNGQYTELLSTSETIDWTSRINYNWQVSEKLNISPTIGYNFFDVNRREITGTTLGGFASPGIFNLGNSKERATVEQGHFRRRIMGAFANVSFGWDDKIFLEYSARNDWSSTLPEGNQAFFYQSVGANVIISDYLDLRDNEVINFIKARGSYGTTGKDAPAYALASLYTNNPTLFDFGQGFVINTPLAGQPATTKNGLIGNPGLKPELTTTLEAGVDLGFFQNRIQLMYTYYHSIHSDQIVQVELPRSSGFTNTLANIGEIENKGHELQINATPINKADGLRWDIGVSWSRNRNVVNKISEDTDELTYYNSGRGITQVAKVGYPVGTWKGQAIRTTPQGNIIVDGNGQKTFTTEDQVLAGTQPDWLGNLSTSLTYKGFRLGALLDTRQGGKIFSLTQSAVEFNGTSLNSTMYDRHPFVIPGSVVENEDGTFSENTTPVAVDDYLFDGNYSRYLIDGSYIKFRELTLGYNFPTSLASKLKMKQLSVQLFVKNPKIWVSSENNAGDPEVNNPAGTAANVTGVESTQTPNARSYGFNLNVTF